MGSLLPGGWPELMEANRDLVRAGRDLLCRALKVDAPAPDEMLGSMATVPLPEHGSSSNPSEAASIGETLFERYRIEVPIIEMPVPVTAAAGSANAAPTHYVRISAQRYNDIGQYASLADALVEILGV
jgi:isopenicillin-N epimerase